MKNSFDSTHGAALESRCADRPDKLAFTPANGAAWPSLARAFAACCLALALTTIAIGSEATEGTALLGVKDARKGELALGAKHRYAVQLEQGGFAKLSVDQVDLDLVVALLSPDGEKLQEFDSAAQGEAETITFEASRNGRYELVVSAFAADAAGRYAIKVDEIRDAAAQAAIQRRLLEQRQAATAWAAEHAMPLKDAEPGIGIDDLKVFDSIVGDARVVMLGEATHGTREFFQLKHRMLEYLVEEKGFNIFAIEANQPEAFRLNRYVLEGVGDPAKALAGLYFWTWNTEEVFEMIHWMRRYNADPKHARKLKFYGFDMQSPQLAARHIEAYLAQVDQDAAARAREQLSVVDDAYKAHGFMVEPLAKRAQFKPIADRLLQQFDRHKSAWIGKSSVQDWAIARQHAVVLAQSAQMMGSDDAGQTWIRAKAMADNLLWIARHEGKDARIVGWAHNGHVSFRPRGANFEMGGYLRAALGEQLRVIGFGFAQGSFQAIAMPGKGSGLRAFTVGAPPVDSLDAMLADAKLAIAAIDLRTLPTSGPAAQWFAEPRRTRSIGAIFEPDPAFAWGYDQSRVQDDYDALIFVERTSAARPMPWGIAHRKTALAAATNLDFERGELGDTPNDWQFSHRDTAFGFRALLSDEQAHSGNRSALLLRDPGPEYGLHYGQLSQIIDATPYRGKRIRVRAWLRVEAEGEAARGHLRLSIDGSAMPSWGEPYTLQNFANPLTGSDWQERTLEADVAADALRLNYGAVLVGTGRLWIDDVVIEVLGPVAATAAVETCPPQ